MKPGSEGTVISAFWNKNESRDKIYDKKSTYLLLEALQLLVYLRNAKLLCQSANFMGIIYEGPNSFPGSLILPLEQG